MDNSIVKLLYNYLNLKEISRLRVLCKSFRNLIDRDFEMLFNKALNKIDAHNDINQLITQIYGNRSLLIRVLQYVKNTTGYVLDNAGLNLYALISVFHPNDKELKSYIKIPNLPLSGVEDRIGFASTMNLEEFKKSYVTSPEGMQMWSVIVIEYIRGIFKRNTTNHIIDWDKVNQWNKTNFFRFIKGALKKKDYANIITGISRLSHETRRRNHHQLVDFIQKIIDPMIEDEIQLIRDVQAGNECLIVGYDMELNRRMPDIHDVIDVSAFHKLQMIVTESILRAATATSAMFSDDLFTHYWHIANEVFDYTDDKSLDEIQQSAILSKHPNILTIISHIRKSPMNITNLHAFLQGWIRIENLDVDPYQKLKLMLLTNGVSDFEHDIPITPLVTVESNSMIPSNNILWVSKAKCKQLMKKLDELGLWDKIPYFYDIFITRDIEFWTEFITTYSDSLISDPELFGKFIKYHVTLNNVDVIKYMIESKLIPTESHYSVGVCVWFQEILDEYNEKNNITPVMRVMPYNYHI